MVSFFFNLLTIEAKLNYIVYIRLTTLHVVDLEEANSVEDLIEQNPVIQMCFILNIQLKEGEFIECRIYQRKFHCGCNYDII